MGEQKVMNRWLVVVGALLIQLALGAIYAWSVFTTPLTASNEIGIADSYKAVQLGLEEAAYTQMQEELKPLREQLKGVSATLSAEKDAEKKKALKAEVDALKAEMSAIVKAHVPGEKLEALRYGFTKTQSQVVFAVGLAFFALIMVIAGRLMPKLGPRTLAMSGGVVLGAGYLLAGLIGGKSFIAHLICIGVIGGSGIGLAYVVPIAVAMQWFPDKKGLITGLAVAGFGFGATIWVKLAGSWAGLIANMGLPTVFTIYGVAFLVMVVLGAVWMVFPPKGFKPEGWNPPETGAAGAPAAGSVDYTSGEMLRTPQFYMIWTVFIFSAGAGLMSIGLMKLFPMQALTEGGLDAIVASGIAGTAMAIFFSLANGIGRIAWGAMSDKLGRKNSVIIMTASQGLFVFAFTYMAGTPALLYLGATLIGFNFGGNFALFPTLTADTFGAKFVGQNYGWVFLAYGIGGVLFPILGGVLGDMGNFPLAFTICGGLCVLAAVIAAMIKPAVKKA